MDAGEQPAHVPGGAGAPAPRRRFVLLGIAAAVLSAAVTGLVLSLDGSPEGPPPAAGGPTTRNEVAYDFDSNLRSDARGVQQIADSSGKGHTTVVRVDHAGQLVVVPDRRDGNALRFPARCSPDPPSTCPRAIVQVASGGELDPGTRDFAYGAAVLLRSSEVGAISSVMQKGTAAGTDASGWRLEVDAEGRPSCVLVAKGPATLYAARSADAISDGGWHTVTCTRRTVLLTIEVDGVRRGEATLLPDVVIQSTAPMRLGGTSIQQANDQFFGALDDVFFRLGG